MDDVAEAEFAAVGALLAAPEQLPMVRGWLRPDDFANPACALVYGRLLELDAAGLAPRPVELLAQLRARGEVWADGYPVPSVLRMLATPAHVDAAPAYGRLVVEAALARAVHQAGTRLRQAAGGVDIGDVARVDRLLVVGAEQRVAVTAAAGRWEAVTGSPAHRPAVFEPLSADERARGWQRWRDDGVPAGMKDAEWVTVGCLLEAPRLADRLGWLRVEDFGNPSAAAVFGRVRALTAAGVPVDRITVQAALRAAGQERLLGSDPAATLRQVTDGVPAVVQGPWFARRVLAGSLVRFADAVGGRLQAAGVRRAGGAGALLGYAAVQLDALIDQRPRWRAATGRELSSDDGAGWSAGRPPAGRRQRLDRQPLPARDATGRVRTIG